MKFFKMKHVALTVLLSACSIEEPSPSDQGHDLKQTDTGADVNKPNTTKDTTQTECDPTCENGEVCKTENFTCVGCLSDTDCDGQVCDTDSNTCVDCKDNSLCPEAAASTYTDGTCGACAMDTDCTHVGGLPRCDAGTCKVECEDDSHCGGMVCDITTNLCTQIVAGSAKQCETCVSDSQCPTTHHCIALGFRSPNPIFRDNYCVKKVAAGACMQPYDAVINKESLNGASAEDHCGVNQRLTTCEAVLAATDNVQCKADNVDEGDVTKCPPDSGARCEKIGGNWKCTYSCNNFGQCSNDCVDCVAPNCVTVPATKYCQ